MLTIDSASSSGTSLLQMLQTQSESNENLSGITVRGGPESGSRPPKPPEGGGMITEKAASFAEEAGLDADSVAALQEELDSAISSALENGDGTTDPRELIDGAIAETLSAYDLDSEAFISELTASMPAPPSGMGGTGTTMSSADFGAMFIESQGAGVSGLTSGYSLLDTLA